MVSKNLRALAKAYFQGEYDRETYQKKRSRLIKKITEEPILSLDMTTSRFHMTKYTVAIAIAVILLVVGGILSVFWIF
jgi:hypothetical protein